MLSWKKGGSPHSFLIEGKLYRRPDELANIQVDYFTEKVRKLSQRIQSTGTNPLRWLKVAMESWEDRRKLPTFKFSELSLIQVIHLISKLGNSVSYGTDNIDALAIKAAAVHLAPPIRHLINISLSTSTYANKWKLAKLVPLLKSLNPIDCAQNHIVR